MISRRALLERSWQVLLDLKATLVETLARLGR